MVNETEVANCDVDDSRYILVMNETNKLKILVVSNFVKLIVLQTDFLVNPFFPTGFAGLLVFNKDPTV